MGQGLATGGSVKLRLRFTTARQVFEVFPTAYDDIEQAPTEAPPLAFVQQLKASETPEDAIGFCAYLLPRREAVWWGCHSIRAMNGDADAENARLLGIAEAWFSAPDEDARKQALEAGLVSVNRGPAAWVALAAGWSGGSLVAEPLQPVPPAPHLTAQAVRAAVLTALALLPVQVRRDQLNAAVDTVIALVEPD